MSLLNLTGRHRLTPKMRAVRAWTRVRYAGIPFWDWIVVGLWYALVAASGIAVGFIWGQAI